MQLKDMSWPAVDALSRDIPVLIPIAAVEQHGHHLPLYTDSYLLGEVVQRAEGQFQQQALVLPLQWYGNSHHHMDFAGTLSAEPRTYLDMLHSVVSNMLDHGFRRILVINGHGGNDVPGKQSLFEIRQNHRQRDDLLLLFATYWSLAGAPKDSIPELVQKEMAHACEWETSMMLAINPELVGDYLRQELIEPGNPFRPAARAWTTKDRSPTGHIGCPAQATPEKGEKLLAHFASGITRMIERMQAWDGQSWDG
ncbi:MAG: creatininase family protein [Planctomycetota bacterium]